MERKTVAYRIYMSDAIMALLNNTAKYAGGSVVKHRYVDLVENDGKKIDNRTGTEIAADVIKRAGLVVKKHEPI